MAKVREAPQEREELSLNDAASHLLEECRTVVPGMQALFGFQLIAVFNNGFRDQLSSMEQMIHLTAIVLVAIAIALVMAPAALHRQTEPLAVSRRFIRISSRLFMASMGPLAVGLCLDIYVVTRVIVGKRGIAATVAASLLGVFIVLWLLVPRLSRSRRTASESASDR